VKEATNLPPQYQKLLVPLDECKPVRTNTQLLLTSSGGGAILLDRKTRRPLFHAHAPMAHSAEMLPGERIVVALSTHADGNSLELYSADQSENVLWRDPLPSGHGVLSSDEFMRPGRVHSGTEWGTFRGKFGAEEFLERVGGGQGEEKIGERVAEGMSDDEFRGRERMVFGAQPADLAQEGPPPVAD